MARASTGNKRGVGSRLGWPLKIFVGVLLVLLVLLILNAFALNNETKSAGVNVPGATLVETTSGQLQVLDTGNPAGTNLPIVLIHGSAGAINWWDDLIPLLKPDHRVIAIDLLGYGGSDKPDSDYSIETQANLVAQVLGKLKVGRAVLVGHSLGGSVVTSVAEQSPDLAAGLVLIDSGPDTSYGGLSGAAKASRTPVLGQALWRIAPDSVVRKNLSQGFAPGYNVPDKYVQDVRDMTYPAYDKSSKEVEKFIDSTSLPDRLAALGKPLLVIFGEEDQIYDARESLSAYAAIPDASTLLIPGSGHSPQVEAPEKTAQAINDFAAGIARKQARQALAAAAVRKAKQQARKKARAKAKAVKQKASKQSQKNKQPAQKNKQPVRKNKQGAK